MRFMSIAGAFLALFAVSASASAQDPAGGDPVAVECTGLDCLALPVSNTQGDPLVVITLLFSFDGQGKSPAQECVPCDSCAALFAIADFNPNCDYVIYEGWHGTNPNDPPPPSPPTPKLGVPSGGLGVYRTYNPCNALGGGWTMYKTCNGVATLGGWINVLCPCVE